MRIYFVAAFAALLLVTGCATGQKAHMDHSTAAMKTMPSGLVDMEGNNYFVWEKAGRIYVLGQETTNQSFVENFHLPYARTLLGAGPNGETVVFEIDKKNPQLADRLEQAFRG